MNSFKSTEQSRFCSFPRITLDVVWNYQLRRDNIWSSIVTSYRKLFFIVSQEIHGDTLLDLVQTQWLRGQISELTLQTGF